MRTALLVFLRWLHTIALALWLGGLIAIGALVAPAAFHVVRVSPAFAGNLGLQNNIAGGIVGSSLHSFTAVCFACGFLLLFVNGILLREAGRQWTFCLLAVSLALLLSVFYLGFALTPAMEQAQNLGNSPLFDQLHHRYEMISIDFQFPLLLLTAFLSALRDTRHERV